KRPGRDHTGLAARAGGRHLPDAERHRPAQWVRLSDRHHGARGAGDRGHPDHCAAAVRIDPRTRFSPVADLYDRFRPDYPDTLMRWLLARAALSPGACVADVGCGPRIATRHPRPPALPPICPAPPP